MRTFENRVAVITGAGGGIGRALSQALASRGAHLALADVSAEALARTAAVVRADGLRVSQHVVDVTNREQMAGLPAAVLDVHGGVNLLINNAGITLQKSFATHSLDDWERVLGINFRGVLHGCHYFLDSLREADEAHIVNMSSMVACVGLPSQSSYCATKAAVKGLSESLWAELAVEGIGVTSVHPGAVRTDMIKATLAESDNVERARRNYELTQKTAVSPEKVAAKILRAVEKRKLRVRIGADAVILDVAKRIFPVAIHRPMVRLVRMLGE